MKQDRDGIVRCDVCGACKSFDTPHVNIQEVKSQQERLQLCQRCKKSKASKDTTNSQV